ncbi:protein PTST-like protein 3, chloroplastic isoform X1 [Senna tora]|uniref:Protein PTST-like protein 3, chloroplastic isoform X1 n=1 Tax=Senna tora TaxID=362788 RepID=A0A834SJ12_9FABA|nr:protein PTST-like protein 3, chloroplastic isoform X1 [Senna tora]
MATVCYFSTCPSFSSCNHLSLTRHHQLLHPRTHPYPYPSLRRFHLRASATKNSRRSRKLKSDAELCNDIREFVAQVGFPEDHVPSTKELLQHGRSDLANIVRRRGYKLLRELLTSSLSSNVDVLNTDESLEINLDGSDDCKDLLTGQNLKVDVTVDGMAASNTDSSPNTEDDNFISVESSANSSAEEIDSSDLKQHANEVNYMAEGFFFSNEASVDDGCINSRRGPDLNFDNQSTIAAETSRESSVEEKISENLDYGDNMMSQTVGDITLLSTIPLTENHNNTSFADSDVDTQDYSELDDPDDSNNDIAENAPSSIEVSIMENVSGGTKIDSIVHSADNSCINVKSSVNLSLEEKVAKFILSGDLDPVEDHAFGISNGSDSEESEVHIESGSSVEMMSNVDLSKHPPKNNTAMAFNGSSLTSQQIVSSATVDCLSCNHFLHYSFLYRDDNLPNEDQTADFNKDLEAEATKKQNQSEINHLKFMLYQKELELSQLKEQIEKEKLALSVLQTKAEEEINKARKLISEKDAELHVAEESLSGLKEVQIEFRGDGDNVEVQIEFRGDGDNVEVTGSFNGWHHKIKMDCHSSCVVDPTTSRRSRLWSTVLWLYPGVYEIKFVVDGHWSIDPQRESVTRGHICNNILRVDR